MLLQDCTTGNQCNGAYLDQYIRKIGCAGGMVNEVTDTYKATDVDACTVRARKGCKREVLVLGRHTTAASSGG